MAKPKQPVIPPLPARPIVLATTTQKLLARLKAERKIRSKKKKDKSK